MRIFLTGAAGFIGFHLTRNLLDKGHQVVGYDGMTPYYDVKLKRTRLRLLNESADFTFVESLLEEGESLKREINDHAPDIVIHLAAQAGVRYSLENPGAYVNSNVVGTFNVLEAIKEAPPRHLLFASTSSIYGGNEVMPFCEVSRTDFPVSLYAATKKAGEALTHSYSHIHGIPTTCFRFFTVYGPWGRPDMALFKFVERLLDRRPIEIYGEGDMRRDFTYIDDLIESICLLMNHPPELGNPVRLEGVEDSLSPVAPWRTVNIGGGRPVDLISFVEIIESELGIEADRIYKPMQMGDVRATSADTRLLKALTGFEPAVSVEEGVAAFIDWYRSWR